MILWTVKLISTARRAIAGRKYPHQLSWAVAFGLLLGVVPHGNLLAIVLLVVVLSLKINHAMAALTAVAATFIATKLDPISHEVGDYVLTHPQLNEAAVNAWQLPLVPWTDLNNTVVMGSFLIGVGALVPVFMVTYPVFRLLAPASESSETLVGEAEKASSSRRSSAGQNTGRQDVVRRDAGRRDAGRRDENTHQIMVVDPGHARVPAPQHEIAAQSSSSAATRTTAKTSPSQDDVEFVEIRTDDAESAAPENRIAVETRIDVIRMKDHRNATGNAPPQADASNEEQQPMDEALNYLLRQLRDSQQRNAA